MDEIEKCLDEGLELTHHFSILMCILTVNPGLRMPTKALSNCASLAVSRGQIEKENMQILFASNSCFSVLSFTTLKKQIMPQNSSKSYQMHIAHNVFWKV